MDCQTSLPWTTQKVLKGANIKLGSVVSDVLGVSGRDLLDAIANVKRPLKN